MYYEGTSFLSLFHEEIKRNTAIAKGFSERNAKVEVPINDFWMWVTVTVVPSRRYHGKRGTYREEKTC